MCNIRHCSKCEGKGYREVFDWEQAILLNDPTLATMKVEDCEPCGGTGHIPVEYLDELEK